MAVCDNSTLCLVTILFRHGDRTPDIHNVCPKNPYKNHSFSPYGFGDLTYKGQARMIRIGKDLRYRYHRFLDDKYYTDIVTSTTSSYTRCQLSMQCLHAGLFPPDEDAAPVLDLPWHAVPYKVIPFAEDKFISFHMHCPKAMEHIGPSNIPVDDYNILKYICEEAGHPHPEYIYGMRTYDFFKTCAEQGLELPEWILPIWPTNLKNVAYKFWYHFQEERRKFGAGPIIKRITEEAKAKIDEKNNENKSHAKKMYLYCVHDMNLHIIRGALQVWNEEPVEYGAHLIFELHKIDDVYGFKIFYQNDYDEPQILILPGYDQFISLQDFETFTKHLYEPEEVDCENLVVEQKPSNHGMCV